MWGMPRRHGGTRLLLCGLPLLPNTDQQEARSHRSIESPGWLLSQHLWSSLYLAIDRCAASPAFSVSSRSTATFLIRLISESFRSGFLQQIEDRQRLLIKLFPDGPALFLIQFPDQLEQSLKCLLDGQAVLLPVVIGNDLLVVLLEIGTQGILLIAAFAALSPQLGEGSGRWCSLSGYRSNSCLRRSKSILLISYGFVSSLCR